MILLRLYIDVLAFVCEDFPCIGLLVVTTSGGTSISFYFLNFNISLVFSMVITRSQARSRQPLDPAASPRANPPRRALSQRSSIPRQSSSEGGVSCSTRAVGGGSATPLAAGNDAHGSRHCRSDCMTCPSLNRNPYITSFVTGRIYPIRDISLSAIHCKLQNYVYLLIFV